MKINGVQLGEALLSITLDQFQSVPAESEIHHTFSQRFQEKMLRTGKKSERITWRVWQTPMKRALFIAMLIILMLVTIACATPAIRNVIIELFITQEKTAYGITFNEHIAANAPRTVENLYVPTFEPEGYTLVLKEHNDSRVEFVWMNKHNEYINYRQSVIQQGTTSSTWISIDAEEINRSTKNLNGYSVEIISNKAAQQFIAVWTDNQYIYLVNISVLDSDPETILEAIMNSLTEAQTID